MTSNEADLLPARTATSRCPFPLVRGGARQFHPTVRTEGYLLPTGTTIRNANHPESRFRPPLESDIDSARPSRLVEALTAWDVPTRNFARTSEAGFTVRMVR
jgi:hypothetical protein